ncbi:MAG TPA: hypothetical protein V6C65_25235 [Allocoleopsis sp.]
MATLRLETGKIYTEMAAINRHLQALQVKVDPLPLQEYLVTPETCRSLQNLFSQDILNLTQKQEILQALSPKFAPPQHVEACSSCELMVVSLSSSHLYQFMAQGSRPRCYSADEVFYVLSGECIFGFSLPNGSRLELMLQAQERIKVPAGVRHWVSLSALLQVKAIRYLTGITQKNRCYLCE